MGGGARIGVDDREARRWHDLRLESHLSQKFCYQPGSRFDAFSTAGDAGDPDETFEGIESNGQVLLDVTINFSQNIRHRTTSFFYTWKVDGARNKRNDS